MNFRYGGPVAILAAAFGLLGPVAAQAGQIPGSSVPACAEACGLKAPAAPAVHLSGNARAPVVLTSVIKRSSGGSGYGRERFGLPGQRDRMLQRSDRCGWWGGEWRCGDRDDYRHGDYYDRYRHGDYDRYRHGDYDRYRHGDYDRYRHGDRDDYRHYR